MNDLYIRRMRAIRDEFDIVNEILEYISRNRQRQYIINNLSRTSLNKIEKTLLNLEITYFVRLTAEFEGILKDHLRTYHPEIKFPARQSDWKVDWFLSKILRKEKIILDNTLRDKLNDARDYRNSIAHSNPVQNRIGFTDALSWYNTLLAKLGSPRA